MKSWRILIVVLMLVAAACGGDDDAGTDDTIGDGGTDTTATTTAGGGDATTTTAAGGDGGGATGDFSTAVVTIGGDTYEFRSSDFPAEVCNTNFFGGVQIVLSMADEFGEMILDGGSSSTLNIVLIPEGTTDDAPMVEFNLGAEDIDWIANADSSRVEGSAVTDWSVDGDRVEGTATFVSTGGDGPTDGSFEATCVE